MAQHGVRQPPVERQGRRMTPSTAWWFDHHPRAYTLYCVHNMKLAAECKKCNPK